MDRPGHSRPAPSAPAPAEEEMSPTTDAVADSVEEAVEEEERRAHQA